MPGLSSGLVDVYRVAAEGVAVMPAPTHVDYGRDIQYTKAAEGWTFFCPLCKAWGDFPRLSFAYTAGRAHKKVAHYA